MNSLLLRGVLGAIGAIASVGLGGCGCGVGADPNGASSAAGVVEADGTVRFTPIERGSMETFPIPVRESADTSETIQGASVSGSGAAAFKVLAALPINVPNGQDVPFEVQFAPTSAGTFEAQLLLQTAKMGTSQIPLVGTGL
jgi:hypothetical protein